MSNKPYRGLDTGRQEYQESYSKLKGAPYYLFSRHAHYSEYYQNIYPDQAFDLKALKASINAQKQREAKLTASIGLTVEEFCNAVQQQMRQDKMIVLDLLVNDFYSAAERILGKDIKDGYVLTKENLQAMLDSFTIGYNSLLTDVRELYKERSKTLQDGMEGRWGKFKEFGNELNNFIKYIDDPTLIPKTKKKGGQVVPGTDYTRSYFTKELRSKRRKIGSFGIGGIGEDLQTLMAMGLDYKGKNVKIVHTGTNTSQLIYNARGLSGEGGKPRYSSSGMAKTDITIYAEGLQLPAGVQVKTYQVRFEGKYQLADISVHSATTLNHLFEYYQIATGKPLSEVFQGYFINSLSIIANGVIRTDPTGVVSSGQIKKKKEAEVLEVFNLLGYKHLQQFIANTMRIWLGTNMRKQKNKVKWLNTEFNNNDFFIIGNDTVMPTSVLMEYIYNDASSVGLSWNNSGKGNPVDIVKLYKAKISETDSDAPYSQRVINLGQQAGIDMAQQLGVDLKVNLILNNIDGGQWHRARKNQ